MSKSIYQWRTNLRCKDAVWLDSYFTDLNELKKWAKTELTIKDSNLNEPQMVKVGKETRLFTEENKVSEMRKWIIDTCTKQERMEKLNRI
jgi:hypothetical protein